MDEGNLPVLHGSMSFMRASSTLRERLKPDVKAALALFDLLSAGTHRMSSALTEREVTSILRKVESILQFLIESSE